LTVKILKFLFEQWSAQEGHDPKIFESALQELQLPPISEALKQELLDPVKMVDPETGQRINTLQLNRAVPIEGSTVTVFIPPINNDISAATRKGEINYTHSRIAALAQALPDSPFIAFDYPSVGGSDKMTDQQASAFAEGHGFEEIVKTQLRILKELGITDVNVVAQSLGAFTGAHMARLGKEFGINVKNAVLTETPGVLDVSVKEMFFKRLMPENALLGLYHVTPIDPNLVSDVGIFRKAYRDAGWLVRGLVGGRGLAYGKEVSKDSLEGVLDVALQNNPDMKLTLINGTTSMVAPNDIMRDVSNRLRNDHGDRVRRSIFPGASHVVMEQPKRYAWMTRLALRK